MKDLVDRAVALTLRYRKQYRNCATPGEKRYLDSYWRYDYLLVMSKIEDHLAMLYAASKQMELEL